MKQIKLHFSSQNGFSLIEMVVVIIVIGVLSIIALSFIVLNTDATNRIYYDSQARSDMRTTLSVLRNQLQKMSPDSIVVFAANGFNFYDIDGNRVWFLRSGGDTENFYIGGGETPSVVWTLLARNLTNSTVFRYLDAQMNETVNQNDLCLIEFNANVNYNGQTVVIQNRFYLRN